MSLYQNSGVLWKDKKITFISLWLTSVKGDLACRAWASSHYNSNDSLQPNIS